MLQVCSPVGSGDSGAAGGPSNSAIKMPAKIRTAPKIPRAPKRCLINI
jgi:hypothetical protein